MGSFSYKPWRAPLALGGASFIGLHGLFHAQMILNGMIPADSIVIEMILNILPSIFTVILAGLVIRAYSIQNAKKQ